MWPLPSVVAESMMDTVVGWLATAILAALSALWALLEQTAFTSPDVTVLPQVITISGRSQMIVNTVFVLAIIAVGVTVMTHETVQVRYGVGELLPRLVLGFIAANFATPICAQLIETANALTGALTGDAITTEQSFAHMQRVVRDALSDQNGALLLVVIGMIIAVLTGMLLVTWLVRIGVLVVLVGIAPAALACHATPFTDPAARLWWRCILGVLATVLLQALVMHTAVSVFLNPDADLAALGIPQDTAGVGNLIIVACLLWLTVRIPAMMRRYVTRGGQNSAGLFLRMLLIQQVSRFVRLPSSGRGRAAAAGAGRARAAAAGTAGGPSAATTVIPYWRPRMPRHTPAGASASRPATGNPASPAPAGASSSAAASSSTASGGPSAGGSSSPPRRTVPAGTTPATAMPPRRPRWQAYGARPSGTGWPDPPPTRGATGNRPAPAAGRPSGTGWPGTRVQPAGDPRYPVTRPSRPGANRGS